MTIEHRTGDLFAQPDVEALGQGVNCRGVMGSGIAPIFKRRWMQMFSEYRELCLSGQLTLGGVFPYETPEGVWLDQNPRWVYNIASQYEMGRNANLEALSQGVTSTLEHAVEHQVRSLALPRIGAGIGGLRWEDVLGELKRVSDAFPAVTLVVVSLPGA